MFDKKILFGAAILGLGLTACSSDEPDVNGGTAERDMTKYIKVAICTAGDATKAGDNVDPGTTPDNGNFDPGTGNETVNESAVKEVLFAFYDQAGGFITTTENDQTLTWSDVSASVPNVERRAEVYVPINIEKGQNMPAYVLCFINPDAATKTNIENKDLDALRNVLNSSLNNGSGAFSMNNSVYYGKDMFKEGDPAANGFSKISGTPIDPEKIYPTQTAAEEATDASVDIYVERYASKLTYKLNTANIQNVSQGTYTLTFEPQAWAVNADAADMYLVKKFALQETDAQVPTFSQVNDGIKYFVWNQPEFFRSYWACAPHYYADKYPVVSDNVKDNWNKNGETGAGEKTTAYGVKYYSYNQIVEKGRQLNTSDYFMENTIGAPAFTSRNPWAAAPSAVLVGQYKVNGEVKTFYTIGSGTNREIYFEDATVGTTLLSHFISKQNTIYQKDGDNYVKVTAATIADLFVIEHPSKDVYTYSPSTSTTVSRDVPEWFVTLQLDPAKITLTSNLYMRTDVGTYEAISNSSINKANFLLWEDVKNASAYTNGYAYFSLPIKHLGAFVTNPSGITNVDGNEVIEWDEVKPGMFGLVRNHAYTINIEAINGLGTGIYDPTMPIVPPTKQDQYWFKYRINIQKWRIVPVQNATFN